MLQLIRRSGLRRLDEALGHELVVTRPAVGQGEWSCQHIQRGPSDGVDERPRERESRTERTTRRCREGRREGSRGGV